MSNNDRLISLEERMDAQLHAFGYTTISEERDNRNRNIGIGVGGTAAAGAAAYGYKNRDAIKAGGKKYAGMGIEKAAGGVDAVGEKMRKKAWLAGPGASGRGVQALKKGEELAGGLSKKIRAASKYLSAGGIHAITHLAERIALLELEAEDELYDFREGGRTNKEAYRDRAIMIGGVGAAGAAGAAAYKYSPKFKGAVDGAREGTKQGYATVKKSANAGYESAKAGAGKLPARVTSGMNATRTAVREGYQSGKSAAIVGSAQAKKKLVKAGADVGSRLRAGKSGLLARFAKTAAKAS